MNISGSDAGWMKTAYDTQNPRVTHESNSPAGCHQRGAECSALGIGSFMGDSLRLINV